MRELRKKLLEAYRAGNFLQVALECTYGVEDNHDDVTNALVSLHNEGAIDLIEQFMGLCNRKDSDSNFLSSFNKIPQVVSKEFPNQFQNNSPDSFKTIPHFF